MDMLELIRSRKSVRAFKPEAPPKEVIWECLEAASWAPNQANQQPWKFIVIESEQIKKVTQATESNFAEAFQRRESQPEPHLVGETKKNLEKRKKRTYRLLEEFFKERGFDIRLIGNRAFGFYDAPLGVIFATYPAKGLNFYKSTTAAMENFMLAATARGLGTCWINTVSICQKYIKEALGLPRELILVDGIAVGYADENSPANLLPRERLPIELAIDWL